MGKLDKRRPKNLVAAEKAQRALALRIEGKTYDAIAADVGFADRAAAWNAVDRVLKERAKQVAEDADALRVIELDRLDAMLEGLWENAKGGNVAAVDRVVKIQERRAKLLGLDAPSKQELSGPDGDAIKIDAREQIVGRIASLVERARAKRDPGVAD